MSAKPFFMGFIMYNTIEEIRAEIELSGGTLESTIENTAYVLQMRIRGGYG